jgi:hypothetical protein
MKTTRSVLLNVPGVREIASSSGKHLKTDQSIFVRSVLFMGISGSHHRLSRIKQLPIRLWKMMIKKHYRNWIMEVM